jgi:hypothetical protein
VSKAFWKGFWLGLGQPLGWLLGWGCYWTGHFWSRGIVNLVPDAWERTGSVIVQPYFVLMRWSVTLSDTFNLGIWQREKTHVADKSVEQSSEEARCKLTFEKWVQAEGLGLCMDVNTNGVTEQHPYEHNDTNRSWQAWRAVWRAVNGVARIDAEDAAKWRRVAGALDSAQTTTDAPASDSERPLSPVRYADEAAFPRPEYVGPSIVLPTQWGLSKRELFAAMAMQGLCASVREYGPGRFIGVDELAADSVACADALLTALEKNSG